MGKKSKKLPVKHPTENEIQAAYFKWVDIRKRTVPELELVFHIPNGSHKSPRARQIFKAIGLKAGVPDVLVPVEGESGLSLWIEFKSKKGRVSDEQEQWHSRLRLYGHDVAICRDWAEAANKTLEHLGHEPEFEEGS